MLKMNTKILSKAAFFTLFVIGALLLIGAGCKKAPPTKPEAFIPPSRPLNEAEEKLNCNVGSWVVIGEMRYQVTGVEKHTLGGKAIDLCCQEVTEEGKKIKTCTDNSGDYSIGWTTDEATGKFYKMMEMYKQDEKKCTKYFDLEGNVTSEMCF